MANEVSTLSVIWQECVDKKLCVHIPIIGDKCIEIKACVRLLNENGTIFVEVEALGQRWRYALTNACYTVVEWAIARIRLCVQPVSGGVRLVLEGCLGVDGVKKCWTLIAKEIRFFAINDLSEEELGILGLNEPAWAKPRALMANEIGAVDTPLSAEETAGVLSEKER